MKTLLDRRKELQDELDSLKAQYQFLQNQVDYLKARHASVTTDLSDLNAYLLTKGL